MAPNPIVMQAVEKLNYRVTVGDVASQAGLEIRLAEQALLGLASEAGGHMQVSETGEIAYLFPRNFRDLLRNKYWRLRAEEAWSKVWRILFYLIRISFGIVLIASILLISLTLLVIALAAMSSRDEGDSGGSSGGGGGGFISGPWMWNWYWLFSPDYDRSYSSRQRRSRSDKSDKSEMNFLEAVFSFLFGDGNPNFDLEDQRWRTLGTVIRNSGGAIAAEQLAPYLDDLGSGYSQEYEDYMLPVLTRFNGRPEVSPAGQIIYHFPDLQVMAQQQKPKPVSAYLRESLWRFSRAGSGQVLMAVGLGGANLVGALALGSLLRDGAIAAQLGGLVAFVAGIYWLLLGYGIGFLVIPLARYFWIQWRNPKIEARNQQRQERAIALNAASDELKDKIAFAQQFAAATVISAQDIAYTTETDLTEQERLNPERTQAEWLKRLEG